MSNKVLRLTGFRPAGKSREISLVTRVKTYAAGLLLAGLTGVEVPAATQANEHVFAPVFSVLTHPRCLNCHQAVAPLQGSGRAHKPAIVVGAQRTGMAPMQCNGCHGPSNNVGSGVSGAPHWQLAPESMTWTGLSPAELCRQLVDQRRNGGRSLEELGLHLATDPLVLWSWAPGGKRAAVDIPHDQFLELVGRWIKGGAQCPPI